MQKIHHFVTHRPQKEYFQALRSKFQRQHRIHPQESSKQIFRHNDKKKRSQSSHRAGLNYYGLNRPQKKKAEHRHLERASKDNGTTYEEEYSRFEEIFLNKKRGSNQKVDLYYPFHINRLCSLHKPLRYPCFINTRMKPKWMIRTQVVSQQNQLDRYLTFQSQRAGNVGDAVWQVQAMFLTIEKISFSIPY